MKILLVAVNAKYIHSNLAIYSLREYAKNYCNYISLVEYTINQTKEHILESIYKEQADVIAFSCYIWNVEMVKQVIVELKKVQPEVKIWVGGPEVSYHFVHALETYEGVDGIMIGEGEQTFLELTQYYVDGNKEIQQIPGLIFKDSAKIDEEDIVDPDCISITTDRQPLSLDSIPFPYVDMEVYQNRIIYYESSRGCPFSCSYCLSSIDKRLRLRSVELVKKELKFFLDYKVPQVKFVDRTFNCNKRHAMEIWTFIKEHDNGITNFHFEISADLLDDEEMELLKTLRPSQVQFEIGVQSTNLDTVEAIHRKMDFEVLSRNVNRIREAHNIHQHLDLIGGLPLEDFESFAKSFNDVYGLKPDQFQLGFLKILKGSLMEEEQELYGIVHQNTPPYEVLYTKHLSFDEILKIKGICEIVETYYNSGQFINTIHYLEHYFDTPIQLYLALSEYYKSKALDEMAHTRIRRYEILLDFYADRVLKLMDDKDRKDLIIVFKEILLLDLCLRERLKNRPDFATKPMEYKTIRKLFDLYDIDRKAAHMEQFTFCILECCKTGRIIKKKQTIIFDYSQRDPLNKAAKLIVVEHSLEQSSSH